MRRSPPHVRYINSRRYDIHFPVVTSNVFFELVSWTHIVFVCVYDSIEYRVAACTTTGPVRLPTAAWGGRAIASKPGTRAAYLRPAHTAWTCDPVTRIENTFAPRGRVSFVNVRHIIIITIVVMPALRRDRSAVGGVPFSKGSPRDRSLAYGVERVRAVYLCGRSVFREFGFRRGRHHHRRHHHGFVHGWQRRGGGGGWP